MLQITLEMVVETVMREPAYAANLLILVTFHVFLSDLGGFGA
jgi:hypothetical protein